MVKPVYILSVVGMAACAGLMAHPTASAQDVPLAMVPDVAAPAAGDQPEAPVKLSVEEIDALLAPIALYPDPLLAQIFAASTYPLEVVQAARWVKAHPGLEGIEQMPWDPSVIAIAHFPSVLRMMDESLDWTQRLGQAFVWQRQDVMDSVQQLRVKARVAGSLVDTPQQRIVVDDEMVRILPSATEVIYVPVYDPAVVYVTPAPGFGYGSRIWFGTGFTFGWWFDLDFDWRHRHVYYHCWRPRLYPDWDHRPGHRDWRSGVIQGPGREGDVWRREPRHDGRDLASPFRSQPGRPSDDARGRTPRASPPSPTQSAPGAGPGNARPDQKPGGPRAPTPQAKPPSRPMSPDSKLPAPKPGAAPGTGAGPASPAKPPGARGSGAFDGYQRGTDARQQEQRGQQSLAPKPTPAAPAPAVKPPSVRPTNPPAVTKPAPATPRATPSAPTPRPVAPAPPAARPISPNSPSSKPSGPRATSAGALGGYQSGRDAQASSDRGQGSRKGGKP